MLHLEKERMEGRTDRQSYLSPTFKLLKNSELLANLQEYKAGLYTQPLESGVPLSFDFDFHLQLLSQTLRALLATRASAPDNPADPFVAAIFLVSFFFDSLKVCEIPNTPTPTP